MMQGGLKVSTMYKYFHLQAWLCKVVLLTFMQDKYFSASNLGAAILVCNLPVKCKRGLANDLTHTSITHASLVHNITNGSVYGCITAAYLSKGKKKNGMGWVGE